MVTEELRYVPTDDGAMSVVTIGVAVQYGDFLKPASHADNSDSTASCLFCKCSGCHKQLL